MTNKLGGDARQKEGKSYDEDVRKEDFSHEVPNLDKHYRRDGYINLTILNR